VPSFTDFFGSGSFRVFYFEDCPNVIIIVAIFELLSSALHAWDKHRNEKRFLIFQTSSYAFIKN
jgi:hypothetical protein